MSPLIIFLLPPPMPMNPERQLTVNPRISIRPSNPGSFMKTLVRRFGRPDESPFGGGRRSFSLFVSQFLVIIKMNSYYNYHAYWL